jgi:hypothetical protein
VSLLRFEATVSRFKARTISVLVNIIGKNVFIEWVFEVHFAKFVSANFNKTAVDEEQNL